MDGLAKPTVDQGPKEALKQLKESAWNMGFLCSQTVIGYRMPKAAALTGPI
jgi:hypothetical protein